MKVNELLHVLDGVQAQIRFFDTKAQIVLGIDGILAGFIGIQATKLASVILIGWPSFSAVTLSLFCAAYLAALALSLIWAFSTVYPRLDVKQPKSKIFFAHIAEAYGTDYDKAAKDLVEMPEEDLRVDAAEQILANSLVCERKSRCLKRALFWMGISLGCWIGTLVLLFATSKAGVLD